MRATLLPFALLLISFSATAQDWHADVSYKYLYSQQWDKIIQTYNFDRPFLTEPQPLLVHGLNASGTYIFHSENRFQQGLNVSYSYFNSSAENENFSNALQLHFVNLGYLLHYESKAKPHGFYSDFLASASTSALLRRVNGETFIVDESASMALGAGLELQVKSGYHFTLTDQLSVGPFVSLAYTPFLYSPNTEAVINQTKGLIARSWTGLGSAQVGISVRMNQQ